jgi:hypothetical protein
MDGGFPISCLRIVRHQLDARAHRHVCGRATRGVHGVMAVAPASVRAVMGLCWRSGQAYALMQGHRHRPHARMQPVAWRGVVAACARVVRAQPIAPAACQPTTALAALWICQHQNGCCLGTGTGMDDVSPYHACASCSNSTHVHTGTCVAVPRAACMGPWPWIQPAMPVCVQAAMRPCWRNGQAYALLHAHRHRPHARMQPDWLGMAWRGGRMRSRGACPTQYPTQCTSSLPTYHCPCSVMAMPAPEWVLPRYWHWHGWWVPISCLRTVQQLNARAHRHVCGRATRGVHGGSWPWLQPAMPACVQ